MNTDEAFEMLKEAGVSEHIRILTIRRWLREGKINHGETNSRNERLNTEQNEIIRQLKGRIKAKNEYIESIEKLHENATKTFIQQRDKLHQEIANLKNENRNSQNETKYLLKENIELRNELIKLKEKLFKDSTSNQEYSDSTSSISQFKDYKQKLGLSKMASKKEVLAGYKELLKITHPDKGGNAKTFHYIKTDYDFFRNSDKDYK